MINLTTFPIQNQKDAYPLTDLDMAVPKLDKLEAIEAKKPPPPLSEAEAEAAAAVDLGSFGAMAIKIQNPQ